MNYVPGFSNYLQDLPLSEQPAEDGVQGLPTAQPVQAEPVVDYLNGWDPSMISSAPLNVLSDPGPAYDPNMVYRFNTGSKVGLPNDKGGFDYQNAAPVVFQQGQQYVMVNPLNGNVIGRASTPEEMQKLVDLSSSNKDWQLYRANEQGGYTPGSQLFDRSNAGSLGSLLVGMGSLALPAIGGAALGPLLSGALGSSAAVGTGLGTAIGSAASGVTAGKSLGDILKQAAISGVTAGGLQALTSAPTPNAGATAGLKADLVSMGMAPSTAANIAGKIVSGSGALGSLGEIVVPGIKNAVSGAGSLGGALASAAPAMTTGPEPRRPDYGDKVEQDQQDQPTEDQIVVTGAKTPPPVSGSGLLASTVANFAPSLNAPTTPTTTQPPAEKKTTLSDIADYMNLAGLGIGALGSLFGGNNASQTSRPYAGAGTGNIGSVFNAQLPGASLPGLSGVGGARTAADLGQQGLSSPQDYYRYGYGPEQSFFSNVKPSAPNTSKAYTGYAKGGFAVEGPGSGRDDEIPAMLSDGEYVMDAETVALLGDGSNKKGAELLDKFRVNVRKHKGRELSRGKFSKNAKRPEQYLAGGRA